MLTVTSLKGNINQGHGDCGDDKACLFVRRLVSGLPSPKRKERQFLVLQIWFDDSGKDGIAPVFVLAGYLAPVKEWCDFADAWDRQLKRGPTPLEYLKGYEVFRFNKQFAGWTESDRNARLEEFLPLITKYSGKALAIVIPHGLFSKILQRQFEPFKNPYLYAYALRGMPRSLLILSSGSIVI